MMESGSPYLPDQVVLQANRMNGGVAASEEMLSEVMMRAMVKSKERWLPCGDRTFCDM